MSRLFLIFGNPILHELDIMGFISDVGEIHFESFDFEILRIQFMQ